MPPSQKQTIKVSKTSAVHQVITAPTTPNKSADCSNKNSAENGGNEEIDERETNRRSPNGFLLPDPLPKGEVLADSTKQVNI